MSSVAAETTWEMTVLSVPGEGSSKDQLMAYLHNQLDLIVEADQKGSAMNILEGLKLSGSSPHERLEGGAYSNVLEFIVGNRNCGKNENLGKKVFWGSNLAHKRNAHSFYETAIGRSVQSC